MSLHFRISPCACSGVLKFSCPAARARRRGFAGVIPNDAGIIPPFRNPELQSAHQAWCQRHGMPTQHAVFLPPREPEVWLPPVRSVDVSEFAERTLRSALIATEHLRSNEGQDAQTSRDQNAAIGAQHDDGGAAPRDRPARHRVMPPVPPVLHNGGPLAATRERLPVFRHRRALLDALDHPVSIVEGATGSGKTTQVAQFLLEEAARSGRPVNIVCTQPRRISAIGVADRVAAERGERVGEGAVGYAVRGESRQSSDTSLLFCTTGVLLRMLEEDSELSNVTHVLVDEVHERTVENDFLLLALKSLLRQTGGRSSREGGPMHVCLMSATMDSRVLIDYFGTDFPAVPRISVEGRTFPVTQLHLEDALGLTRHVVDPRADWCRHSEASQKRAARREAASRQDGERAPPPPSEAELVRRFPRADMGVCRGLAALDMDVINIDLICELVHWFRRCGSVARALSAVGAGERVEASDAEHQRGEAVLVFLQGTREIDDVREALMRTELGRDAEQRDWVLPLHGSLPADEQKRVFLRPPRGVVKVVLATNVAETYIYI